MSMQLNTPKFLIQINKIPPPRDLYLHLKQSKNTNKTDYIPSSLPMFNKCPANNLIPMSLAIFQILSNLPEQVCIRKQIQSSSNFDFQFKP